ELERYRHVEFARDRAVEMQEFDRSTAPLRDRGIALVHDHIVAPLPGDEIESLAEAVAVEARQNMPVDLLEVIFRELEGVKAVQLPAVAPLGDPLHDRDGASANERAYFNDFARPL